MLNDQEGYDGQSDFLPSWMRNISDDTPVTALSIPGTHNSCCVEGILGLARTQTLDLPTQLSSGIRFLDIRLTHRQDNLCVHHDVLCTEKSYSDVLGTCSDFLRRHPSETILMLVKNESRSDSFLGELAPSRVFCKLSNGDADGGGGENSRSFEDTFKAKTWEHIGDTPLFYNFTAAPPDDCVTTNPAFTSEARLGEVRGKIVLLRRFKGGRHIGLDLTYWPENQRFRSANPPFYDVEDRYQNPGDDSKFNFVISHIEKARDGDLGDLYITFSSAVDLTAHGYSQTINPRLRDYLRKSARGRVGVIVMDYFNEPADLVSSVIKMNFSSGAASGRDSGRRDHDGHARR